LEQRNTVSLDLMTYEQGEKIISLLESLVDAFDGKTAVKKSVLVDDQLVPTRGRYERVEFPDVTFNVFYDRWSEKFENPNGNGRIWFPPNGTISESNTNSHCQIYSILEDLGFVIRTYDVKDYDTVSSTFTETDVSMYPVDLWANMNFGHIFPNISDSAKKLIREQKVGLFLSLIGEAFSPDEHQWIRKLSEGIIAYDLTKAKIVITCADLDFPLNYSKWGERNKDITNKFTFTRCLPLDYFQYQYQKQFMMRTGRFDFYNDTTCKYGTNQHSMDHANSAEVVLAPADSSDKKVDLICMNAMSRPHRIAIVSELYRLGMQDNYISLLFRYQDVASICKENSLIDYIENRYFKFDAQKEHFRTMFVNNRTKRTIELDNSQTALKDDRTITTKYFKESFFSLVTETCFGASASAIHSSGFTNLSDDHNTVTFVTEKTYKPIAYFHPFIILGSHGTLQHLRDEGYETFPEMFDESYDTMTDLSDRFCAIVEQVEKWKQLPLNKKIEIYNSIKPKLQKNHDVFTVKYDTLTKRYANYYKYIGSSLR
jgi:hypothetical protein